MDLLQYPPYLLTSYIVKYEIYAPHTASITIQGNEYKMQVAASNI